MNSTQTKGVYVAGGLVFFAIAAAMVFFVVRGSGPALPGSETVPAPTADTRIPSVSGQLVAPDIANRRPIIVMVENHPDARPQTGLSKAELVYETVAEGGITRYVAVFQQPLELVGPVRSARDYFAELANGFGGVYAHVGGSPEVLSNISQGVYTRILDLNEFFHGAYFLRDSKRAAPHNAYAKMNAIAEDKLDSVPAGPEKVFTFGTVAAATAGESAGQVSIDFSLPSFAVRFTYDPATNSYVRQVAGKSDVDAVDMVPLSPRSVIVEEVSVTPVPGDDKLRVDVGVIGSGKAYFFQNGRVTVGTWSRQRGKPAVYKSQTGAEVVFEPGQVWIAGVPADGVKRVSWSALEPTK